MENNSTKKALELRELPSILTREEMVDIMQREVYGYIPKVDFTMSVSDSEYVYGGYKCNSVEHSYVTMTISVGDKSHSFRVDRLLHKDGKKRPTVILNNFHRIYESRYFPIEEMTEYDANFVTVCYTDVSSDDGDFTNGLAPLLLPNGRDTDTTCGKIGIWAWANMRLVDYALTLEGTDENNIAVAGHSRLGKTALLTGMMDTRIKYVFSNAAGCAGDALYRGNSGFERGENKWISGELISDIVRTFPFWFCKNYFKYTEKNYSDTFDQHFVLAAVAPRYVLIGSCSLDYWADPKSQQLCVLAASSAWENEGLTGFVHNDEFVKPGESLLDGHIGFFQIESIHYFSRHSWRNLMRFIEKHKDEN